MQVSTPESTRDFSGSPTSPQLHAWQDSSQSDSSQSDSRGFGSTASTQLAGSQDESQIKSQDKSQDNGQDQEESRFVQAPCRVVSQESICDSASSCHTHKQHDQQACSSISTISTISSNQRVFVGGMNHVGQRSGSNAHERHSSSDCTTDSSDSSESLACPALSLEDMIALLQFELQQGGLGVRQRYRLQHELAALQEQRRKSPK